ncbi:MAG: RIP metalloprotease RseP [Alphaproteobacteria bacterium]
MDFLPNFLYLDWLIPFLVLLTVLVFVHELGHYAVARFNGVRVEVFSIGFGPELFGWNDRAGTRWKFSAIPLGGYVRMLGEDDLRSAEPSDLLHPDNAGDSFSAQRIGQRAAIVAAGPAANFLFAIIALAILFATVGQPYSEPVIGTVMPGSAAEEAGFQPGDRILSIDGTDIDRFEDVQQIVRTGNGAMLSMQVRREGAAEPLAIAVQPKLTQIADPDGAPQQAYMLGLQRSGTPLKRHGPVAAVWAAAKETYNLSAGMLGAVGEIILGRRGTEELGGPVRIAQMSGDFAKRGIVPFVWFAVLLSINLGLINLLPIPVLDGGHLAFYAVEAVRGRPVTERTQEYSFRIGLALVIALMIFVTYKDLDHLRIFEYFKNIVS